MQDPAATQDDLDFTVMSYDVGHEKPDKRIFNAAEEMLELLTHVSDTDAGDWDKLHVGDEYQKDIVGAKNASWYGVLINGEPSGEPSGLPGDVVDLTQLDPGDLLQEMRDGKPYVALDGLERLAQWLGIRSML